MGQIDPALAQWVLDQARHHGANAAEALLVSAESTSAGVRLGEVETIEYQRDRGLGVTVYFGKRKGSASTAEPLAWA